MRSGLPLLVLLSLLLGGCDRHAEEPQADFAVLAQADPAYAQASPERSLVFPADHGAHPDFRIEWWYLTANLSDMEGRPWGLQWTLFRTALRPPGSSVDNPWQSGQIYMAHFAATAPDGHRAFQRYGRGGHDPAVAQAGATAAPFAAWLDDWRLASLDTSWLPLRVQAAEDGVAADLVLRSDRSLVLQGDQGFSQKHAGGGGSYYYSQPWLAAEGTLHFAGQTVQVRGQAWLDREWSSQFLQPDQQGWDWFSLHLANGDKLMAFQLRPRHAGAEPYGYLVLHRQDGTRLEARPGAWQLRPRRWAIVADRRLPLGWRLQRPEAGLDLAIEAGLEQQWMAVDFPYWEGRVEVTGPDGAAAGVGYLEMTGYPAGAAR